MNLDELWNSPANAPGPIEREAFVAQTLLRVARERRQRKGMLIFSAILLLLSTAPAVYTRITDPAALGSSRSLYLMLASQWLLILYWARQLRPAVGMTAGEGDTIQGSLARLLWEVEAERRSQLGVVVLFAVFAPLLALAIRQLVASDKMTPDQAYVGRSGLPGHRRRFRGQHPLAPPAPGAAAPPPAAGAAGAVRRGG